MESKEYFIDESRKRSEAECDGQTSVKLISRVSRVSDVSQEKRSEIVRIFRRYSRLGVGRERLNPIQMYARIESLCPSRKSRLDMLAVYEMIRRLELYGEDEVLGAISAVYLADGSHRVSGTDISFRVKLYAAEHFCDERTVYRRLERARELYKSIREREGLLWDGVK